MSFNILNRDNRIILKGGMSAEICFAKYIAYRSGSVYQGWTPESHFSEGNVISKTLEYIVHAVETFSSKEHTALISPGILSVPYITELMNILYLPSQLLISVKSISTLKEILSNAGQNGIKCYAEVGYDACMPEGLVAWIKFLELPPQYLSLLEKLGVKTVMTMCVNTLGKPGGGENIARIYNEEEKLANPIVPGNILFLFINEGYGKSRETDLKYFIDLVPDLDLKHIRQRVDYICDWESGIVDPERLLSGFSGKKMIFCAPDTLHIYDLSWKLTEKFIRMNGIQRKGFVLNPYFINNPLYEAYYGYVAYSFWQGNEKAYSHFLTLLGDYGTIIKPDSACPMQRYFGEVWANIPWEGIKLFDILQNSITHCIKMSSSDSDNVANWIEAHRPEKYPDLVFVSLFDFTRICRNLGMSVD